MFPLLLGLLALPLQRPLSPRSVGPRLSASSMAPPVSENALVIGAGPAGIASAIMLAQRGYQVEVLDRLEAPAAVDSATWSDTARFYLIGLGGRGQLALQKIGAWASVDKYCSTVVGRKDWSPGAAVDAGVERVFSDRPYLTKVIQRDRLVSCLLQHAKEAYGDSITVRHSVDVNALHWETGESGERAVITCVPCGEEGCGEEGVSSTAQTTPFQLSAPLLVGADGVSRTVGEAVAAADADRFFPWRRFRIRRYEDTSVRVYKTVPFELPEDSPKQGESSTGWRGDINYSARTKTINFDALPSPSGGYCGVLLIKPEDAITQSIPDVPAAREYFDELLPQFSPLITDEALAQVINKEPSRLPIFRYAGPRLHHRESTVMLGDAVHTVKPYFGLGVNAAFEDVVALGEALDTTPSRKEALELFSQKRSGEAEALVKLSRSFDRSGLLSFATFILPLILDGIFHGAFPKLFAPNCLAMLQKPQLTFRQICRRKRLDRLGQLALLGLAGTLAGRALVAVLGGVLALGSRFTLSAGLARRALPMLALLPAAAALAKALQLRRRVGTDVADVLATQPGSLGETEKKEKKADPVASE